MFDWNNIFNIAFVASIGGLSLFFLISTIAVAAKGKRKCNAFDVILRILSSLCFVAALLVIGCAVLSTLEGELCIKFAQNAAGGPLVPTLAFFGKDIVLPLAELFLIFSTAIGVVIGFACAAALFVLSLMALIVDCLVANQKVKNDKKAKKAQKTAAKTPEQIKREKELERIKKIGESAVRKTAEAAEKSEQASAESRPEPEQQQQDDWREQPKAEPAEFVGIKETENEFDTFDDIPESADEAPVQGEPTEEIEQPVEDESVDRLADEADEVVDEATEEPVQDFAEPEEYGDELIDEPVVEAEESVEAANEEEVEAAGDIVEDDASTYETDEATDEEPVEQADEVESVQDTAESERVWNEPEDEAVEEQPVADEEPAEQVAADESAPDYGDIEPDRDIYIPEIRTIVKTDEEKEKEPAPVKKAASAKKSSTSRNSGGSGTKSTARGGQKSSGARTAATRAPRSGGGAAAKRTPTPQPAQEQPAEKKLPVTRRYVILDRRNAVNMFGEYLRERNKADKEKLQSSINTIIIE